MYRLILNCVLSHQKPASKQTILSIAIPKFLTFTTNDQCFKHNYITIVNSEV